MDGELGLEQSQAVADHLAECASCADDFRSLRQLVHWASMVPEVDPPAHFPARILAAALASGAVAPAQPAWSLARAVRELRVPPQFVWAACATAAVALAFASTHPSLPRTHPHSNARLAMVPSNPTVTVPPVVITPITPPAARPAPVPAPPSVHIKSDLPPAEAAPDTERAPEQPSPLHATAPGRLASIQSAKPAPAARAETPTPRPAPHVDAPPITATNTPPPATQPKSADPSNPPDMSDMMAAAAMPTPGMDSSSGTMGMATEKVAPARRQASGTR